MGKNVGLVLGNGVGKTAGHNRITGKSGPKTIIIQGPASKNKANQKQTSDQITQIVSGGEGAWIK